jgi:hypothetical protein
MDHWSEFQRRFLGTSYRRVVRWEMSVCRSLSLCHKAVSSDLLDIIFAPSLLTLTSEMMLLPNDMKDARSMSCSYQWTMKEMRIEGVVRWNYNFAGPNCHAWYQVALLSPSANIFCISFLQSISTRNTKPTPETDRVLDDGWHDP